MEKQTALSAAVLLLTICPAVIAIKDYTTTVIVTTDSPPPPQSSNDATSTFTNRARDSNTTAASSSAQLAVGTLVTESHKSPLVETSYNADYTSYSNSEGMTTVSENIKMTAKLCTPFIDTLSERNGAIALTHRLTDCSRRWRWQVRLPFPEDGIVINFNAFLLDRGILTVINRRRYVRILTNTTVNPLRHSFLYSNQFDLVLMSKKPGQRYACVINMTYTAYPKDRMPKMMVEPSFFNCTGDVVIPSILWCNHLRECYANEDENNCEAHLGCGDWIPFRDQCFKIDFYDFVFNDMEIDRQGVFSVQRACQIRFEALPTQLDNLEILNDIKTRIDYYTVFTDIRRVTPVSKKFEHLYRYLWQWRGKGGPIDYNRLYLQRKAISSSCAIFRLPPANPLRAIECQAMKDQFFAFVCKKPNTLYPKKKEIVPELVHLTRPNRQIDRFPTRKCSDESLVQKFHLCYQKRRLAYVKSSSFKFALFLCQIGPSVHYTLVCDGNGDCFDGSDEADCGRARFPPLSELMFVCDNFQMVPREQRCDGQYDCFDQTDEQGCAACQKANQKVDLRLGCITDLSVIGELPYTFHSNTSMKSVVWLDGYGLSDLVPVNETNTEGTFKCLNRNYSIPSFLLNNGELDCPSGEDENIPLEQSTCPGYYRCLYSGSCIHPYYVCDGVHHCPYKDDERYCDMVCPNDCLCEGFAFSCRQVSNISHLLQARHLDLSGSLHLPIILRSMHFLEFLKSLNLSHCNLNALRLTNMQRLQRFDLSFNKLTNLSTVLLEEFLGLVFLDVSGNPFLQTLDVSFLAFIKESGLTSLRTLIMKGLEFHSIRERPFSSLTQLERLDLRNSSVHSYDKDVFWGLESLQQLYADNSRLCCPYFHGSRTINCDAPSDELSSCSDLLRSHFFRVFLWLISLLAILNNSGSLLYRLVGGSQKTTFSAFRQLINNLCSADLFMGVYMMLIGIADAQFQKVFAAKESVWKESVMCKLAGFLGFVSNEASALTICLITLDRVLVVCFPLKPHFHLAARSSTAACCVVWLVAVTLAALPLMGDLQFYGVSSICLPLPITRRRFSGQFYSFGVFIVFNFLLFVFIGLGQIVIYIAILRASKAAGTCGRPQEMTIARRLFLVVLSDFCCWFPIGLMGLLAVSGVPMSGEVNVWSAIFVLPLNSALNPFLYTLNNVLEKRKVQKLKVKTNKILANIQTQLTKMPRSAAEEVVKLCVQSNVLKKEKILRMLQSHKDSTTGDPEP